MAVPSRVLNAYRQIDSTLDHVERYVSQTLRAWCDQRSYPFKGRKKNSSLYPRSWSPGGMSAGLTWTTCMLAP